MPRHRLNAIIRFLLAATIALTVAFTILAARPGYRDFGAFAARIVTPQPLVGLGDVPGLFVMISNPAVVKMPSDWNLPDQICMTVRLTRGPAQTELPFFDQMPQIRWDDRPGETVLFGPDDFIGTAREGGRFVLSNAIVGSYVTVHLKFRVNWFGQEQTPVYADTPVGGLVCYHFAVGAANKTLMQAPFVHQLSFKAKNINVTRRPAFNFIYNVPDPEKFGPDAMRLQAQDIESYLSRLVVEAPYAVIPMTVSQVEQRATEYAQINRK